MATRKIRLTLSGTQVDGQGPIVDIDFNGENLDVDLDVTAITGTDTLVKEYTVDVDAGTYNLDIDFKNDIGGDVDRNLEIEKIEISNNGVDYEPVVINTSNSNLVPNDNFLPMGWLNLGELNPDFVPGETRTDDDDTGYVLRTHPGANPRYQYEFVIVPVRMWNSGTGTVNITFV